MSASPRPVKRRPAQRRKAPAPLTEPEVASGNGASRGRSRPAPAREPLERARAGARDIVSSLQGLLGTEAAMAQVDPAGLGAAVGRFATSVATHPASTARAALQYGGRSAAATIAAVLRSVGVGIDGPAELRAEDGRYGDPAWTGNALFYLLRQHHALLEAYLAELVDQTPLDDLTRRKASFAVQQMVDTVAPTNLPVTNPAVLKKAFDTGGHSVVRGVRNLLRDIVHNGGKPRQVTPGQFRPGHELAATPGKVVYRNRLIELIQYEPQTEQVHAVPLLCCPPWINKYYIMDLAPQKSLVEWAVQHGHTCFMISYRNPDSAMADVTMGDYLREGPLAALDVVEEITGTRRTNLVGLCLGGTIAMCAAAWLTARGEKRLQSITLLNTLLDFRLPGQLGIFTEERTVDRMELSMKDKGYLPAGSMATTFNLLRANDLVWNYVVNDWLLGEEPPPFEILSWNSDSTRMPAAMQVEYLRTLYLENRLATGELELAGEHLDLSRVREDAYFVSAEVDHIAPWKAVYEGAKLPGGTVRFMLSNSGHIAGVVNPPSPKSKHWVGSAEQLPDDPEAWRSEADEVGKSWWEDWTRWIAERGGEHQDPPSMGSSAHPSLEDAPGGYVLQD
ncbi:MAG: PHA/PHB synthase family protein [Pseudonocardiaceae bacterium]